MSSIKKDTRAAIYDRDGHHCQYCGNGDNLTIDHIVPRSRGGTNKRSNLRTLCGPCNNSRGDSMPTSSELSQTWGDLIFTMRRGALGRALAEAASIMRGKRKLRPLEQQQGEG